MEYLGEVVTDKEFKRRMHTDYQQDSHHYCLHVGEGLVIDGHRMGGECRFVNHSCKPNCEMQKWSVNGMWRMALFSRGPIGRNEELTYDYNFSLFNPHEGQTCHCGNEECRGVIGGKGRKNLQKTPLKNPKSKDKPSKTEEIKKDTKSSKQLDKVEEIKPRLDEQINRPNLNHFVPLKPMTVVQQQFCRTHSVLLLRNLEKIRKLRDLFLNRGNFVASQQKPKRPEELNIRYTEEVFKTGLTALATARSVQTRRLAIAQDNPDVSKVVQIAKMFQEILESLKGIRTENGENMINNFVSLPSKEDLPQYNLKISEPIDFSCIEKSLSSGSYHSVAHIDQDVLLLFQNNIRFYGSSNRLGEYANVLRKKYMELCMEHYDNISEIVGLEGVRCLMRPNITKTDDIIQCPCGQLKDEGVMVQCDDCSSWQHIDCIKQEVDPSDLDTFICEKCCKVKPKLDIALVPQPEFACPGETYFVSMEREDGLHVTLGMTVYVLRAFKESEKLASFRINTLSEATDGQNSEIVNGSGKITMGPGGVPHKSISPIKGPSKEAASLLSGNYPTYKTVDKNISADDMDIFRVERLWINEAGKMFAFGYHYLRPHETFHEPTRRFFDNEVFRVPLYEVLPLDTIWRQCWVMDPASFCRGRPNDAEEEHVYICEYRVDKTARLFNKISKPKYPVCTKFYAFNDFDLRLKVTRAYTPHEVPDKWSKTSSNRGRDFSKVSRESSQGSRDTPEGSRDASVESNHESAKPAGTKKGKQKKMSQVRETQKPRRTVPINQILTRLLSKQGEGNAVNISHLLEGMKRKRNRTNYHEGNYK